MSMECASRINHYLSSGGLFNPELMEHQKVSELLQDCRTEITALEEKLRVATQTLTAIDAFITMHPQWSEGDEKVILKNAQKALEAIKKEKA